MVEEFVFIIKVEDGYYEKGMFMLIIVRMGRVIFFLYGFVKI